MELTQLKWEGSWEKTPINQNLHKLKTPEDLLKESKLEHFAQIEKNEANKKVLKPFDWAHVEVNWKEVKKQKTLNYWDSISLWEKKENIFAVHEKWEDLKENDVKKHLEKAWHEINEEEFNSLLKKLEKEEKIIREIFIAMFIITLVFFWAVFYLWNTHSKVVWKVNKMIIKQEEISEIREMIWEFENTWTWEELQTITEEIMNLKSNDEDIKERLSKLEEVENKLKEIEDNIKYLESVPEKFEEISKSFIEEIKADILSTASSMIEWAKDNSDVSNIEKTIEEIKTEIKTEEIESSEKIKKVWSILKMLMEKTSELQWEVDKIKSEK